VSQYLPRFTVRFQL